MKRNILIAIPVALVLIFVLQNIEKVEVMLFFWKVSMSRALMLLLTLLIGIIVGWFLRRPKRTKKAMNNS